MLIPIGSPWMPRATKRRHWADPGFVGDVRARSLQFRIHDRRSREEIVRDVQGRRHLQQPLGRIRHVLLRALPEKFPEIFRAGSAAHRATRRIPRAGNTSSGIKSGSLNCGGCGMAKSRSDQSECELSSRMPAAAR